METHVKVLAVLHLVLGVIGVFGAFILMLIFGGAASVVGSAAVDDPDAAIAIPIIGITGMALVAFLLVLSVPALISGFGLLKLRPWARILGIVISILMLMAVPLGTIVGAYGLWVLLTKETERLFMPAPRGTTL
jgi:hypothetical protein